jgi:predicted secreted hydrolase
MLIMRGRRLWTISALVLLAGLAVAAFWYWTRPPVVEAPPLTLGGTGDATGFSRALEPRPFSFPRDHGPHLDYQTEWWYYTGNLDTADGQHVGFQLTFFRRGLSPRAPERASAFGTNQIYFAHFAVTDVSGNRHQSFERFSRGAAGLAGASGDPYRVWLDDWQVEALDVTGDQVRLRAAQGGLALDLTLTATKPIVAHGDAGLSPKSGTAGNASYYLSFTRLATTGTVTLGNAAAQPVTGESWFDHEWSTSALGAGAIGWDWFSLQLGDGQELMYFQIRQSDGSLEPVSGGTLVAADGTIRHLAATEVQIEVLNTWRSPASGANYPSGWRITIPSAALDLRVTPWIQAQEMQVSFVYWEGAVRLAGTSQGAAVTGNGFIELTGYAASIAGQF